VLRVTIMTTHSVPRLPLRFVRRAVGLALSGLTVLAVPASAQGDFVGLSSLRSTLFIERTQEGFFPSSGDLFGFAFVAADFSGDGVDELVTGIPTDNCSAAVLDCGAVFLSWGNPGLGLIDQGGFLWAGAPGSPATAGEGDKYGRALAAGDFNHDGLADLVIGAPGGNLFAVSGNAQIHYGLPGAIQVVPEHILQPGIAGVPDDGMDDQNRNARFGAAFAVGDFNGDGHDDLATGSPDWTFEGDPLVFDTGAVVVAHGHLGGLVPFEGFLVTQDESGIPDDAENFDRFGSALAAGDFNGDAFDDLVIGVPREDGVGAILVLFGSPDSLLFANHYWLGEVDLGSTGASGDRFGETLATGDFDGDGFDDLAIGVPGQDDGDGDFDIGMVGVLYGAAGSPLGGGGGFNWAATQWWWEGLIGEVSDGHDLFGMSLAAADFNGDGFDDLAIGAPGELIFAVQHGEVLVLPGGAGRLSASAAPFSAGRRGLAAPEISQTNYGFGEALVAGDFDGNGFADLVVGMPKMDLPGAKEAGGELVLYGSLFSDGFESGDRSAWSTP